MILELLALRRLLDRRTILHWTPAIGWRLVLLPMERWQEPPTERRPIPLYYRSVRVSCHTRAA